VMWVTRDTQQAMDVERDALSCFLREGKPTDIHWRTSGGVFILTINGLTDKQEYKVMRGKYQEQDLDIWEEQIQGNPEVVSGTQRATLRTIKYLRGRDAD